MEELFRGLYYETRNHFIDINGKVCLLESSTFLDAISCSQGPLMQWTRARWELLYLSYASETRVYEMGCWRATFLLMLAVSLLYRLASVLFNNFLSLLAHMQLFYTEMSTFPPKAALPTSVRAHTYTRSHIIRYLNKVLSHSFLRHKACQL